ncbi:substrate-binding periplasmic protein [Desulfocurvus sp. DL9XJH121]
MPQRPARPLLSILAACLLLAASHSARAFDASPRGIEHVRTAGPSWEGFTNHDGRGLYHEILKAVFGLYGVRVTHDYVPSQEAYDLVRVGRADMMLCHDKPLPGLTLATEPMYEGAYYVLFLRRGGPAWDPPQSLEGRSIAWRRGYYAPGDVPASMRVEEADLGVTALDRVADGGLDFYLDDLNLIQESLKARPALDPADFRIEPLGRRSYRPLLKPSQRGLAVRDLYDLGMAELRARGELRPIFEKWGFPLPAGRTP